MPLLYIRSRIFGKSLGDLSSYLFFPSGQKCRLRGSDILKEREEESSPSRRKAHESSPEVYPGESTVLSSRMLSLPGLSETVTAGSDVVGAYGGHTERSDQVGACRLSLS